MDTELVVMFLEKINSKVATLGNPVCFDVESLFYNSHLIDS